MTPPADDTDRSQPADQPAAALGTVLVAGATGAVGRPLCRLLVAHGWRVVGTTRSSERAEELRRLGVEPVVVDVFDRDALVRAVVAAAPDAVIHQLTDLPAGLEPSRMEEGLVRTARLRQVGTRNLLGAALQAGARRFVAQSIAFAYAPGDGPLDERHPLAYDVDPERSGATGRGVAMLEHQVLGAPITGIVLRYGRFYGPGTGGRLERQACPVHVEAAAEAARLALTRGSAGVYNVAEDDGSVSIRRAREELGWDPAFRLPDDLGAAPAAAADRATPSTSPIDARLGAVFVPVSDIHRSAAWYAALLGHGVPPLRHEDRICTFALANGSSLVLDAHRPVRTSSQPLFFLHTADVEAARAHLDTLGARVEREVEDIGSLLTLTFADPDGNLLMVCQPKA